jgi:hypothetical protein
MRFRIRYIGQNLRKGFHPIVIEPYYQATINTPINISFFLFFLSYSDLFHLLTLGVKRINVTLDYTQ